ncbi:MAG: short-chain fatty acid transporter, partial [Myxococcales bacterium]|nr:short-chain fatty acid transporter [Myxococcales bacterium]
MIRGLGRALSRFSARYVPDPFVIALLLTAVTFALAWGLTGTQPLDLLGQWGGRLAGDALTSAEGGVWRLLAFGMQMCLILVTGFALADSGPVRRLIGALARQPRTQGQAITVTAVTAMLAAWLNWGLGLIVGALLAREVARSARARGVSVHYPLLGAAGYTGLMVWHGGLSGTAPFKVTQAKDVAELLPGAGVDVIPLTQTILSPLNLTVSALLLVAVPVLLTRLSPPEGERVPFDPAAVPAEEPAPPDDRTGPAAWLERSPLLSWGLGLLALIYL